MLRVKYMLLIGAALVLLAGCGAPGAAQGVSNGPARATGTEAATTVTLATEPAATEPAASSPLPTEPAVSSPLATPTAALAATAIVTGTESSTTATTAVTTTTGSAAPAATGTIHLALQPDSQVGYRVREQLARVPAPSDAVGTTKAVTGTLVIQPGGKILSDQSKFVVDLSTLTSDSGMRDGYIRRSTLQTSTYPEATFVPTSVQGLPSPLPTSGDVSFKLTGDLTAHGVTKPVTWDVKGTIAGNDMTGTATTSFKFEDFGMTPPQTMMVLSVQDNITLEATYHLTAAQQ